MSDDRKLSDIGNELHNLSCHVVHHNEDWANQLGALAYELWNWNTRAQASQAGEAVEVVGYLDAHDCLWNETTHPDRMIPLMTVGQHQRILAASVGSAEPVAWREHSVNYAKGEKCPETIETLQAAWDRDQELINDMRHEIARHKTRINRLEQRRPADQVADDLAMVKVSRELLVKLLDEGRRAETWAAQDELRALLNGDRS